LPYDSGILTAGTDFSPIHQIQAFIADRKTAAVALSSPGLTVRTENKFRKFISVESGEDGLSTAGAMRHAIETLSAKPCSIFLWRKVLLFTRERLVAACTSLEMGETAGTESLVGLGEREILVLDQTTALGASACIPGALRAYDLPGNSPRNTRRERKTTKRTMIRGKIARHAAIHLPSLRLVHAILPTNVLSTEITRYRIGGNGKKKQTEEKQKESDRKKRSKEQVASAFTQVNPSSVGAFKSLHWIQNEFRKSSVTVGWQTLGTVAVQYLSLPPRLLPLSCTQ